MRVSCVLVYRASLPVRSVNEIRVHRTKSKVITLKAILCISFLHRSILQDLRVIHHLIRKIILEVYEPLLLYPELLPCIVLSTRLEVLRICVLFINNIKILIVDVWILVGVDVIAFAGV